MYFAEDVAKLADFSIFISSLLNIQKFLHQWRNSWRCDATILNFTACRYW